ncbi:MFS domain-containing protein [Caenorhabditis elegans]|nr:MFS domain-containing protein [Caenorhabditis elegans]NP_001303760.1 MFS domain-containing protein [Caenorhabditis elegans]CUR30012.1 MFS domain-containing protein [Caenorhabditis elegans]CUR30059.1 MFS domain-containing protein [Caenorhabditis elegans]|eukprot:NP_001303713.1 MonoCarboxylate Transporter family [Caenorhabditis elegans]
MVFMGIGAVVGGPIAAQIKDITGNYDISFYVMGIIFAFSGVMTIRLPELKAWEESKKLARAGTEMRVISEAS